MASTPKKSTTKKTATKQGSKKKRESSKMGRPQIEIDKKTFENLCGLMCTLDEIAGVFECSPDTIERWCQRTYNATFADTFKRYSAVGKMSLRRRQFKLAEKSAAMAIFLGKNYLGQTDHVEIVDNTPIERLDAILGGIKEIAMQGASDGTATTNTETE